MKIKKVGILDPTGKYPNPITGQPYSDVYRHIAETGSPNLKKGSPGKGWQYFTTYKDRNRFFKMVYDNQAVLVISGTGTGKTVMMPKLLLHYFDYKNPIIVTVPTRKAIESAAQYSALCSDVDYGKEVAMCHGDLRREDYPELTKILYATDGYVSGLINSDDLLSKYYGIIIDEAHTRGTNIDMLLSSVVEIAKVRPEFKIVVMSATVDPTIFKNFFIKNEITYELYELPGVPNFPVEDIFNRQDLKINDLQGEKMLDEIDVWLKREKLGNIVAFVTSEGKGAQMKKKLETRMFKNPSAYPNIPFVCIIGGKTGDAEKEIALGDKPTTDIPHGPYGQYHRRVIFATNAIEFSVTISDGVLAVIDSGLKYNVYYDYQLNCSVRKNDIVAQSNIKQRCGRTGRKAPGTCVRMYTKKTYDNFMEFELPKILTEDINEDIVRILNIERTNTFKKCNEFLDMMITPIPAINRRVLFRNLYQHNLINRSGMLTNLGRMTCNMMISGVNDFRFKKMLIASYYFNCVGEVIKIICILSKINTYGDLITPDKNKFPERDDQTEIINKVIKNFSHSSGDFVTLLNIYNATNYYIDDEEKRKLFCYENHINYQRIEYIDEMYNGMIGGPIEQGEFQKCLPLIILLEQFNVIGSEPHKKRLEYYKREYMNNPGDFMLRGGDKSKAKSVKKQSKKKQTLKKQSKKKQTFKKKSFKKQPFKKKSFKKQPFKKKFNKKRIPRDQMEKELAKIKTYKKPSKAPPDFRKFYVKKKDKKLNKEIEMKNKLAKSPHNVKKSPNQISQNKYNKQQKKPKRKANIELLKQGSIILNGITLENLEEKHSIKPFKNKIDNILACIFFGFTTTVGLQIKKKEPYYITKNTPSLMEVDLRKMENCALNWYEDTPELIVYNQLSKTDMGVEIGFTNKLTKSILNAFNLTYILPKENKTLKSSK